MLPVIERAETHLRAARRVLVVADAVSPDIRRIVTIEGLAAPATIRLVMPGL